MRRLVVLGFLAAAVVVAFVLYWVLARTGGTTTAAATVAPQAGIVATSSTAPAASVTTASATTTQAPVAEPFKLAYYSECKRPRMYDDSRVTGILTADVIKAAGDSLYTTKYAEPPQVGTSFILLRADAPETTMRQFLDAVAASIKASGKDVVLNVEITDPVDPQVRNDYYKQGGVLFVEFRERSGVDVVNVIQAYDTTDPNLRKQYTQAFTILEPSATAPPTPLVIQCPPLASTAAPSFTATPTASAVATSTAAP